MRYHLLILANCDAWGAGGGGGRGEAVASRVSERVSGWLMADGRKGKEEEKGEGGLYSIIVTATCLPPSSFPVHLKEEEGFFKKRSVVVVVVRLEKGTPIFGRSNRFL